MILLRQNSALEIKLMFHLLKLGQKNVRKPIFSLTIEMLDGRKILN